MFDDLRPERIKAVLLPVGIWITAGMLSEILGVCLGAFCFLKNGEKLPGFLTLLDMLHEKYELYLLLFRDLAAPAVLLFLFRSDSGRIGRECGLLSEADRKGRLFGKKARLTPGVFLSAAAAGVSFSIFMNLLAGAVFPAGGSAETDCLSFSAEGSLLFFYDVLAAPFTEELMLRGLVYRRVRTRGKRVSAMLLSAFLFALLHGTLKAAVFAFFLGLILCDTYEWTGRLSVPVLLHSFCNLTSLSVNTPEALHGVKLSGGLWMAAAGAVLAASLAGCVYTAGGADRTAASEPDRRST